MSTHLRILLPVVGMFMLDLIAKPSLADSPSTQPSMSVGGAYGDSLQENRTYRMGEIEIGKVVMNVSSRDIPPEWRVTVFVRLEKLDAKDTERGDDGRVPATILLNPDAFLFKEGDDSLP